MIDDLEAQIARISAELKLSGVEHRYTPLLMTAPGIGWVLGHTIGAEIGDIERFASPKKLVGYTALCPRVIQSAPPGAPARRQGRAGRHRPPADRSDLAHAHHPAALQP